MATHHPLDIWCRRSASNLIRHILSLTLVSENPLKLDPYQRPESQLRVLRASALCTTHVMREQLLPVFWQQNTFSLRRSSLCKYDGMAYDISLAIREQVHHIQLSSFDGTEACLNIAEGRAHRNAIREQAEMDECCGECRPNDFPKVATLFPNVRTITVDYLGNQKSRICFEKLCRQITTSSQPFCLRFTAVGEAQLMGFEEDATEILFVDFRLRKIWNVLRGVRPDELYQHLDGNVRGGQDCQAVREMKRLALRTTERLIRLLYYYDYECNFLASASPTTVSAQHIPDDLRADPQTMSTEFLTALNWSLRSYLRQPDTSYIRAMESAGLANYRLPRRLAAMMNEDLEGVERWVVSRVRKDSGGLEDL